MSRPSLQTLYGILGPLKLKQFIAIQKCGTSLQDIRQAKAIADGTDDIAGTQERSLPGPVHQILTILSVPRHD